MDMRYLQKCTGFALETAGQHQEPQDITLFTSYLSPFGQTVWISLEYLGIPYKYYEISPSENSEELRKVSPSGLVPALKLTRYNPPRAINESAVILEYLEEIAAATTGRSLLPPSTNPYARALVRLQCDHITRMIVPAYRRCLLAQEPADRAKGKEELYNAVHRLVELLEQAESEVMGDAHEENMGLGLGLWIEGGELGLTDVVAGPWLYRANVVLKHYRGFVFPPSDRLDAWLERLFNHPTFKATCCTAQRYIEGNARWATAQKYIEGSERQACNRPYIIQAVVNVINFGRLHLWQRWLWPLGLPIGAKKWVISP